MAADEEENLFTHQTRLLERDPAGIVGDKLQAVHGFQFDQRHAPARGRIDHPDFGPAVCGQISCTGFGPALRSQPAEDRQCQHSQGEGTVFHWNRPLVSEYQPLLFGIGAASITVISRLDERICLLR